MKHRIAERYFVSVLLMVIFLASLQALSQTRVPVVSEHKVIMKLSDLQLKLSPRSEDEVFESSELNRFPASISEKSNSSALSKKRGKALSLQLPLSQEQMLLPNLAPEAIQEGRDLSPSFKSNPYYIPACSQLIRF